MGVKGYYYNANSPTDTERAYNGQDMNIHNAPFYKEGVAVGQLGVTAVSGKMAIMIDGGAKTGFAFLNWHTIHNSTTMEITLSASNGTLPRIDRVVVRNDEIEKKASILVLEGAYSTNPIPPELTNNDTIQELCLAEIYVAAGAVEITQADITDTRADTSICGFIASKFNDVDFDMFQKQFQSWFEQKKEAFAHEYDNEMEKWTAWFENIKAQLSGDVAGNLQNQINDEVEERQQAVEELNNKIGVLDNLKTSVKTNIVNAINTLFETVKKISDGYVSGVRGSSESTYRTGKVTITKANIGLGNVNNTKDADKSVKYATTAGSAVFASANILKETNMKNQTMHLGIPEQFVPKETDSSGNVRKIIQTNAAGSFLVARVGIPTGVWTIKNIIIPFPPTNSGGISQVGFNHYEGNYYRGTLSWNPSEGSLYANLTGVSEGWENSVQIIDLWIFDCSH